MIQLELTSSKARAHPGRPGGTQLVWLNPAKQNQASVILDKASALGSKDQAKNQDGVTLESSPPQSEGELSDWRIQRDASQIPQMG